MFLALLVATKTFAFVFKLELKLCYVVAFIVLKGKQYMIRFATMFAHVSALAKLKVTHILYILCEKSTVCYFL